jgi:integrase
MYDKHGLRMANETSALQEEKRLTREVLGEIQRMEGLGFLWEEIVDRWEDFHLRYPSKRYARTTVLNNVQFMRNHTSHWLKRPASDINRGDVRHLFRALSENGKSVRFQKDIKSAVNVIYTWAIEERLIREVSQSPTQGIEVEGRDEEKKPEILTRDQVRTLLREAKEHKHPWYPIWTLAVQTGCRSGELQALRIGDCSLVSREIALEMDKKAVHERHYGTISIERSWNVVEEKISSTKARYWRNVPVSGELYWFLQELMMQNFGSDEFGRFLLPRFADWKFGLQAQTLRSFCEEIGIPSIRFHTLRACFATHLLEMGVPSIKVMKAGGWKDLKTMERYTRLAGIDVAGITEGLNVIPLENSQQGVVNLFDYRARKDDGSGLRS